MMSIQYQDGHFGETLSLEEAMELFQEALEDGEPVKALHVGTFQAIEAEKERQDLITRMDDLEQKIRDLSPVKTSLVVPTEQEVSVFGGTRATMVHGEDYL